jgi:hypothetical protein
MRHPVQLRRLRRSQQAPVSRESSRRVHITLSLPCGEQKRQNAANDIATEWENGDSNVRPTIASIA